MMAGSPSSMRTVRAEVLSPMVLNMMVVRCLQAATWTATSACTKM